MTYLDNNKFENLIKEFFPGTKLSNDGYEELDAALRESCAELGIEVADKQIRKAIELYEQLNQRMGVVIVGPSGSGKTILRNLLKTALIKLGKKIKQQIMNPKAISRSQLLGNIDLDTREWTNGVLTLASLQAVDDAEDVNTWIVCDGDVDPEWVESLNSVLDENRLLTLPSGWRIKFGPNVNFIFETHDLTYASPATISRMAVIFLSNEDTNINGILNSWLKTQPEEQQSFLKQMIDDLFYKALDWCMKSNDFVVETSLVGVVLNGLSNITTSVKDKTEFAILLIKGFGGNLKQATRDSFAKIVLEWCGESFASRQPFHIYYNKNRNRVDNYSSSVGNEFDITTLDIESLPLIFTADVQLMFDTLTHWLATSRQHFLLVGPEGCGKSKVLRHCFSKLRGTNVATIQCSSNFTPNHVMDKLSQVCLPVSSSNGRVFTPKEAEHLILYFKDLNLPKPDKYGTSQIISFLQQILTYNGFYDKNNEWVGLESIQIVGSMTAGTGLGRHSLTTRLTSIVRTFSIPEADKNQMESIYSAYLYETLKYVVPGHPIWANPAKVSALASSSVKVYIQLKSTFSVDDHSHYLFTLRDVTRWCTGLMRYKQDESDNSHSYILKIWSHECMRLFRDRLVSDTDKRKFDLLLNSVLSSDWSSNVMDLLSNVFYSSETSSTTKLCTFGKPLVGLGLDDWSKTVEQGATVFSRDNWELEFFQTKELLELTSRCDRVLSTPGGSLLLAGRSGIGRKNAVGIVSAFQKAKVVNLKMGKNYSIKNFKNELKSFMQIAGVENEEVYFIMEDHNMIDLNFLDMINSLLSSGEVPGLYTPEEMEPILSQLKQSAMNSGFSGDISSYFSKNVKKNLHIILIMDCAQEDFSTICKSNPAFFKECSVQWMENFSPETYLSLPQQVIQSLQEGNEKLESSMDERLQRQISTSDALFQAFYTIHDSIDKKLTSPSKYVSLIKSYHSIVAKEKQKILSRKKKLASGVGKLNDAREVVAKLKEEAAVKEKELAVKQSSANDALQMITETMKNANTQKKDMEVLKHSTIKEERQIAERKKVIDEELKEVEPLIQEARKAVGNIKSETLTEVRSLRMPPAVIRDILEATLILMGMQDTSWNNMKSFLSKRGIREEIKSFDARRITPKARDHVDNLLKTKANSFTKEAAQRASAAAAPLASWVTANVKFSRVLDKIQPLEQEQFQLNSNLKKAESQLSSLTSGLDEVDQKVAVLRDKLNQFTKEAAEVEISLSKAKEIISSADQLVAGLEGEYQRWKKEIESIGKNLDKIPFYALISSGFLVYLSDKPENIRNGLIKHWCSVFDIKDLDIKHFLSSEQEMLQWRADGLPSDDLSMENGITIMKSSEYPYIVDPSKQATEWLKVLCAKGGNLEVTNVNDERFFLNVELAVRFGKTLIIEDVQGTVPVLFPILNRQVYGQGPYKSVYIGEKQVDFNPNFRMYLVTQSSKPNISHDMQTLLTVVNFTTTRDGLKGQLLGRALKLEKPELEHRKSDLLKQEETLKIQINELEDELLNQLANSSGNILENKELLDSLNQTKTNSATIEQSLQESAILQKSLDEEGNTYLPFAEFGSKLFFSLKDLSNISNMYQYSLGSFVNLYEKTLKSVSTGNMEMRTDLLRKSMLLSTYEYISRSLFKTHRLMFALHLVHEMFPDMFLENEWEVFARHLIDGSNSIDGLSNVPSWIDEERRNDASKLVQALPGLTKNMQLEEAGIWNSFIQKEDCELDFPSPVLKKISYFQQVLAVQALRPDRLVSAIESFLQRALGIKELSPPALNLNFIYDESYNKEPILMIISPGSDPSQELRDLAVLKRQTLHEVAMGQGQTENAIEKLKESMRHGQWVCLKNLHLMTFVVPQLMQEINGNQIHEDFRLWVTSEAHPKFPSVLLESSLKISFEAPPGIKRNIQTTVNSWNKDFISKNGNIKRTQTLFALAWFHAVIQERRKYIPQGWASFYEFSDSDLRTGVEVIEDLYQDSDGSISWDFVHGLFKNAIYGGRIDNSFDIRILDSYLKEFFNSSVITGTSSAVKAFGPGIELPKSDSYQELLDIVYRLPEEDKPAFFGLPPNIERSYQRNVSSEIIRQIRLLSVSSEIGITFDREKWQTELTPLLNLWKKLNQGSAILHVSLSQLKESQNSPIKDFIELEYFNAVSLIQHVHKTLAAVSKIIRGTALLNEKTVKVASNLLKQQTPETWQKLWLGPEDPSSYIKTIVAKAQEVIKWKNRVDKGDLLNDIVDLGDLFSPDTFLSALAEESSKQSSISMSDMILKTTWSKSGVPGSSLSVKVSGLQLEGASFDGVRMNDNNHKSASVQVAPVVSLAFVPIAQADKFSSEVIKLLYNYLHNFHVFP